GKLQALPTDAKPVTSSRWYSPDEAFFDIAEGIRAAVEELIAKHEAQQWIDQGKRHSNLKRYEEALAAYEQALRLDPNFTFAYYNKGLALEQLKRTKEAQEAYARARQLGYQP